MEKNTIDFKVQADNSFFLPQFSKKEIYLLVELSGGKITSGKERIPLNISLVIDRSGSMQGDKLDYAKKALEFVVKNLNASDTISIVQYDNIIDVVSASAKVKNKEQLYNKISEINARNNTNLSGGMLEGYNQVNSTKEKGVVNRVLLLSDGLANEGITDHDKLKEITQKKFREDGVALSAFGVGADFNEDLMTNLAEYGGGNYYFIDNPDKIPEIFAKELQGLLAVVSQNNQLEITFPAEYVRFAASYGFPATMQNNKVMVNFNDIFAEEQKAALIKFDIIQPINSEIHFGCLLSYDDVNQTLNKIKETLQITIKPTASENDYKLGMNLHVMENIAFYLSNQMYEAAIKELDNRNFEKAKEILAETKSYLNVQLRIVVNSERLRKSMDTVVGYENNIENMKSMEREDYVMSQKSSKYASYISRQRK